MHVMYHCVHDDPAPGPDRVSTMFYLGWGPGMTRLTPFVPLIRRCIEGFVVQIGVHRIRTLCEGT